MCELKSGIAIWSLWNFCSGYRANTWSLYATCLSSVITFRAILKLSACVTLYSSAMNLNLMTMVRVLDSVSTLQQSKKALCFDWTFFLAIKSCWRQDMQNAAVYPSSQSYRQNLIDQNNSDNLSCWSLTVLAALRELTHAVQKSSVINRFPVCIEMSCWVMTSLCMKICYIFIFEGEEGWKIFKSKTNLGCLNNCLLLLHD